MSENYELIFSDDAEDDLEKLDKPIARKIRNKLAWLGENVADHPHKALTGNWSGCYSLRVGDYRAIYEMLPDEMQVYVVKVGHRRNVYD